MSILWFFRFLWFDCLEKREVRRRYPAFLTYERALQRAYKWETPFRICRRFLQNRGAPYGETPIPVLARIAEALSLDRKDHIIDLGCGRGRGVFFLSFLTGCKATGIDWVPLFIERAEQIGKKARYPLNSEFFCSAWGDADLSQASCLYLYGTSLEDEEIRALLACLERLSPTTQIVTVSYPLSDYSPHFVTVKQWTDTFAWGKGEIYVNRLGLASPLPNVPVPLALPIKI